ncbi:GDYXXLXY domain-containing protein [Niabella hibiscisoli]|uniref:GDYXXLXY domain-containing protein n=1 Tax=Niabella hibiscisoli TaxID=1825928 RepID=UPI001F0CFCDE|nr:GDYXXLXY domain-containing protein [Niabella hibiscisoli]MCH5715342.1 GDYXXLXY domain-containing protein [Niabella hibiscisoli]
MKKFKWIIILVNLALLLVYINYSVVKKEKLLKDGQLVLLALAPVDPRSLMQGDYMTLRYAISENLNADSMPKRGYCVVRLDADGVANRVRFQKNVIPLHKGEYLIGYTAPDYWNVNIGAESFFFEEGQAEKYDSARYGG